MTRIRKSFDIDEELRIVQWIKELDPATATGEDVGLAIMFFEGVRENEACGLNYNHLEWLNGHSDIPVINFVQSTKIGSNAIKIGGKTSNAPRILLGFKPLIDFLATRRAVLEAKAVAGDLLLPDSSKGVGQLPIVCRGNRYGVRCNTDDLSKAGRELFARIGISKSELAFLHQILYSHEFKNAAVEEKDPTTYLMRRNCATHLYQLGFSSEEIQYWMGHEIEDPHLSRNSFADPERLYELGKKLVDHPFNLMFGLPHDMKDIISKEKMPRQKVNTGDEDTFSIVHDGKRSEYFLEISACEPNQPVSLRCLSDAAPVSLDVTMITPEVEYPRTAVITSQQQRAYKEHMHQDSPEN